MSHAYEQHSSQHLFRRQLDAQRGPGNLVQILANNPSLYRVWSEFATGLHLVRQMPKRDKELSILRVAWRCNAPFAWQAHVKRGLALGVTAEEIERVKAGSDAVGWDAFDRHLLRAVDELHDEGIISDDTWSALSQRYNYAQLIEFPMIVGFYHLMAFLLNSLRVPQDGDAERQSE